MQKLPDVTFSFLARHKCSNCQLPITCGPVYVTQDLSQLCGRCRMRAPDHYRNYAVEALGSTFMYPCKNWGNHCSAKLRWNDSLDHESECNYIGCCTFFCSHPGAFLKGKRDIPYDELRLTIVPENLLEYLECVLCRGILNAAPVFLQVNGQNICHRCINANGNPPNCRRNEPYEKFCEIFLFPCTYRNRGCKEKVQFGRAIWKHEARCEYGPNHIRSGPTQQERYQQRPSARQNDPQRPSVRQNDPQRAYVHSNGDLPRSSISPTDQQRSSVKPKERGIVKTHTGHIWATITPNKALFAPPDDEYQDVNRKLLKSLAKKQGRQIRRADDIGHQMGRRNSESESVSTNESYSLKTSGGSTPEPHPTGRPYVPHEDPSRYLPSDSRPNSRESGYQTGPLMHKYSEQNGYNYGLRPNESFREIPGPGQYPVLLPHQLNDGFDSVKRVSQRESARGNSSLISELKVKQDAIKRNHSIKGEREANSPYKQCNNLGDIMEVNRQLR